MLGYRGTDDATRQSAIYIAAYNSIDSSLTAPLICQYKGVNDFNLSSHKFTWFAANGSTIRGEFKSVNGDDIVDLIEQIEEGKTSYLHTAWANSADGRVDFTKNPNGGAYSYIGLCSNFTASDSDLQYYNYQWSYNKGTDGRDGINGTNGTNG